MAKIYTFPTLYDECKCIDISRLSKWGYLKPYQTITGATLTWSLNGQKTASVGISANMITTIPFIELDYKYNSQPIRYKVNLVSIPSNLGKGYVWYFLCPKTKMRCRKLYLVDGYFYHRSAFQGCMYEKQTYSQANRSLFREYRRLFTSDDLYQQLNAKYFKRTYKGIRTKKYLKLLKRMDG